MLDTHKAYVSKRFPSYPGSGQDAYADAGDLGADPEKLKAEKLKATNGHANGNGKAHNGVDGLATNGNGKPTAAVA